MKIFFDTEFQEKIGGPPLSHSGMLPISFGFVREDGAELYRPVDDIFASQLTPWVMENVGKHLDWLDFSRVPNIASPRRTRAYQITEIRQDIITFCGDSPEFWADYAAYDWVTLCQLFGTMMDLPKGWPMFCRDFQQLLDDVVISIDGNHDDRTSARYHLEAAGPQQDPATLHHALHDARHLKAQYDFIQSQL